MNNISRVTNNMRISLASKESASSELSKLLTHAKKHILFSELTRTNYWSVLTIFI